MEPREAYLGSYRPVNWLHWVSAISQPFSVCRNKSKYTVSTDSSDAFTSMVFKREKAWNQTQYATDRLLDQHIPSYLIHDALLEDDIAGHSQEFFRIEKPYKKIMNTLIRCQHSTQSYVIHTSGPNLDDLVLRNIDDCCPNDKSLKSGFSLHLGQGAALNDIQRIGISNWNSDTHILVRAACEIYHVKTTDLYLTNHDKISSKAEVILEPVQKWSLPRAISSISSSGIWPTSGIISMEGYMYTWSLSRGITSIGNTPIIDVLSTSNSPNIHSSSHSQIYYISHGNSIFIKDIRSQGRAQKFFNVSSNKTIKGVINYPNDISVVNQERYMFVSSEEKTYNSCSLIDLRFNAKAVSDRHVPDAHTSLKSISIHPKQKDSMAGLIVGASAYSRQIYVHSLANIGSVLEYDEPHPEYEDLSYLLSSINSTGIRNGGIDWQVTSVPVIDRKHTELAGFDIIPLKNTIRGISTVDNFTHDNKYHKENCPIQYNAVLAQQSSIGDVYFHMLELSDTNRDGKRNNRQLSSNSTTGPEEGLKPEMHTSLTLVLSQTTAYEINLKNINSPIQLRLPCGNRNYPFNLERRENESDQSINHIAGLTLESSLSSIDMAKNTYPAPHSCVQPFVHEQCLRGFETLSIDDESLENLDSKQKLKQKKRLRANNRASDKESDPAELLESVKSKLLSALELCPLTLWESYVFVFEIVKHYVNIDILLDFLRNVEDIEEYHLDVQPLTHASENTFDGLKINDEHLPGFQYISKSRSFKESPSIKRCECMNNERTKELFSNGNLLKESKEIQPCGYIDCLLPHLIVFKFKTSSFTMSTGEKFSKPRSNKEQSDITYELIDNLEDEWDNMIESIYS